MKIKYLVHVLLALLAITTVTNLSGAWSTSQEQERPARKADKPQQQGKGGKKAGGRAIAQRGGQRSAREEELRKAIPTLKTSLVEAIALAEKEAGGKAFSAGLSLRDGKPSFQVNLFVGEDLAQVKVDPETKKATVQGKGTGEDGDQGAGGQDAGGDDPAGG